MQRLSLKLPTALQIEEGCAILFHQGGTSRFVSLSEATRYSGLGPDNSSGRIWALVDSSQALPEPARLFCAGKPFFFVGAVSRQSHFGWAKKVGHQHFYMKTWALPEVLQAYVTPLREVHNTHSSCSRPFMGLLHGGPHEESQVRYLYDTYMAPPRMLARYGRTPDKFEALVVEQVRLITPDGLRNALFDPDSDDSSNLIVRMEPSPTNRTRFEKTIASRGVLDLIWDRHLKNSPVEMGRLYAALGGFTATATAVGGI